MTNIDLSGKSYKEIQVIFSEVVGGNAIGKKRADLEQAIKGKWEAVTEPVEVVESNVTDIEIKAEVEDLDMRETLGNKKGYEHETRELKFRSVSAHIRYLYFVAGETQSAIAKQLMVVPQMVSNVVRAEKQKRADAEATTEEE